MRKLEVIVLTLQDAVEAAAGGASSIEIVENLAVGGLTPPLALVRAIRNAVQCEVWAMLRPTARDFVYTAHEIDLILASARSVAQTGADGIVFGALTADGDFDIALTQQVKDAAQGLKLTVHRALDHAQNPMQDLAALQGTATRILCSGAAESAWDGRETLRDWVNHYGAEFRFVCAGGITLANLRELANITGAREFHVGSAARTNGVVMRNNVRKLIKTLMT